MAGGFLLFSGLASAAPFRNLTLTYKQPSGETVTVVGSGDEFSAHFETADGYTVLFNRTQKAYEYAKLSTDGQSLVLSGVKVQAKKPAGLAIDKHLSGAAAAEHAAALAKAKAWSDATGVGARWAALKQTARAREAAAMAYAATGTGTAAAAAEPAPPATTTTGNKVGLTLVVDFSDVVSPTPIKNDIDAFLNSDSFSQYGNACSVKTYFQRVSNGLLAYTNVMVQVTVPNTWQYYNDLDDGGRTMVVDALAAMQALPNYNSTIVPLLATLSTDGSNNVLATNVLFAGNNSGVWAYGLWPMSWVLASPVSLTPLSKQVLSYQITNIGSTLSIGTFCHENGHMLCDFPDLYDYDYGSYGGAGIFSLMGYGSFDKNPAQVDAYLKYKAGWADPEELIVGAVRNVSVPAHDASTYLGTNGNKIYKFTNPAATTEYYLIENREATDFDAGLAAAGVSGGLAIWHVDELGNRDNQSIVPNSTHANYELTLVQADGLWDFQQKQNMGEDADLYTSANNDTITDTTLPNDNWWSGTASGAVIYNISTAGATMSLMWGVDTGAAPTVDAFVIDNGALTTWTRNVTLDSSCTGFASEYMASEYADFRDAAWLPYSPSVDFKLSSGAGTKRVYFQVRSPYGLTSNVAVDTIDVLVSVDAVPVPTDGTPVDSIIATAGDENYFMFTLVSQMSCEIETQATGTLSDTIMSLYGPNALKPLIETNDDADYPTNKMSFISRVLDPGIYYVKVTAYGAMRGTYSISVKASSTGITTTPLVLNAPPVSGAIAFGGDVAWYSLDLTSYTNTVRCSIQTTIGTLTDTAMALYGPGSMTQLIAMDDDGGINLASRIDANLKPGLYYVKVTGYKLMYGDFTIQAKGNEIPIGPYVSTFAINNGAAATTLRTVTLNNTIANGPMTGYMASEDPTFSGVTWLPYSAAPHFVLSAGAGTKTVYFKVRDTKGQESNVMQDDIALEDPAVLTLNINNGAAATTSRTVTLDNTVNGTMVAYRASENLATIDTMAWLPYSAAPSFVITSTGNGLKTVYFKVKDADGQESTVLSDDIFLSDPPVLQSFLVTATDGNTIFTTTTDVLLTSTCVSSTSAEYQASEYPTFPDNTWYPYTGTENFSIATTGTGVKTVYFKIRNAYLQESNVMSDSIVYVLPPTIDSVLLNGGAIVTPTTQVKLSLSCSNSPDQFAASETAADLTGPSVAWKPFAAMSNFTLSAGAGTKTVYVVVRNSTYNLVSAVGNASIELNGVPVVLSFAINSGSAVTNTRAVKLTNTCSNLTASGNVYMASENSGFSGAAWLPYTSGVDPDFTLSDGNGTKKVYFKVMNSFGQVSATVSDTITQSLPPEIVFLAINNGAAIATSTKVTLTMSCKNTPTAYMVSEDPAYTGATWKKFTASAKITLSAGNGLKVLYVKVKNAAGEASGMASIILSPAPVVSTFAINNGATSTASRTVTLDNVCKGGTPMEYLASERSDFAGAVWQPYAAHPSFTITAAGTGTKYVYFKVRTLYGQESARRYDTIKVTVP